MNGYTLNARTAARLLGVRHSTVSQWAARGRLPFQWFDNGRCMERRFRFADIAALIDWQRA